MFAGCLVRCAVVSVFAVVQYEVCVYTGSHWAAGTEASVFILLLGSDGNSDRLTLLHSNNKLKFARNQVRYNVVLFIQCIQVQCML